MKKSILIIILSVLTVDYTYSQDLKNIRNATDCENAIEISTLSKFGPTNAPKELKVKSLNNPFERAQYPVWYKFNIAKDGVLLFDIIPIDPNDNYDFLLYKIDGSDYCHKIKTGEQEAIRSNFARSDMALQGKTGLSVTGKPNSYSKGIDVKKGEEYLLVLNNMYKGKGHTLIFSYLENFIVKGNIVNASSGQPLKSNIYWTNLRTNETTASSSSNKQGDYKLKVSVSTEAHRFPKYLLWAYTDKYYISDTIIASKNIDNLQNGTFNFKLHKLKKGNNDFLPKIYFDPNSDNINSNSSTDLERLHRLLKQNQQLEIILEGHSNGFYPSNDVDKALSESRAEKVKAWLVDKGVDEKRIGIRGLGSNKMIYPYAENEKQEGANRRVEIFIEKY